MYALPILQETVGWKFVHALEHEMDEETVRDIAVRARTVMQVGAYEHVTYLSLPLFLSFSLSLSTPLSLFLSLSLSYMFLFIW